MVMRLNSCKMGTVNRATEVASNPAVPAEKKLGRLGSRLQQKYKNSHFFCSSSSSKSSKLDVSAMCFTFTGMAAGRSLWGSHMTIT